MPKLARRSLFAAAGLLGLATRSPAYAGLAIPEGGAHLDPLVLARDEAHWERVSRLFERPEGGVIQLEHGQFGAMTRATLLAYSQRIRQINRQTTLYTRSPTAAGDLAAVRAAVAGLVGCTPEEVALTRGATESLKALIAGYGGLNPGDAVLYCDLDYDAMQQAMAWLAHRRGVRVVRIALPEPATYEGVIEAYEAALRANPDVRMMLLTHVSHRTGLLTPVREITEMARSRGVDVILDAAHAVGQTDVQLAALGVDFAGLNLHKWIGAPLGCGAVYIRKDRIGDIEPDGCEPDGPGITARVHTGTFNYAAMLSVPDAIRTHEAIGPAAKAARLSYLRNLWAETLREDPRIEILTPPDGRMHAGITSFRIRGRVTREENRAICARLLKEFGIFTVDRDGPARGACVRVSPHLINTAGQMQRLVEAVRAIARS